MRALPEACRDLRAELQRLRGSAKGLGAAARAHLLTCEDCQAHLRDEESLEGLLDELEVRAAPPGLAGRVLGALAPERHPAGRPRSGREEALDALLEAVPVPGIPAGLSGRVLAGLAAARQVPARRRPLRRVLAPALALAAAAALVLWLGRGPGPETGPRPGQAPPLATTGGAPAPRAQEVELESDEDLLAYAVENWDLLLDPDLDLWLASLDPLDEVLIELGGEPLLELADPAGTDAR